MIINVTYDQNTNTLPSGFVTSVAAVVQFFESQFSDPITFNLHVGYGEVDGTRLSSSALGQSLYSVNTYTYSQVRTALQADARSNDDLTAVATLAATDPTGGGHILIAQTEAAALGLIPVSTVINTYVGFSNTGTFDYNTSDGVTAGQYDFFGVVAHEISEVMGRELAVGQTIAGVSNSYYPLDFFHYSSPGARDFSGTLAGYFSFDGGITNLNNFNTNPADDFGDWASAGHDSFLAVGTSGVTNPVSEVDLRVMDILGYNRTTSAISATSIQDDYLGITRTTLSSAQATTIANAINAGSQTESQYVNGLLAQVANTTIPAVAVEASMYGVTGTSKEITSLTTNFLPPQLANAAHFNLNQIVYACEALGLTFAFGNETGSTAFINNFGPSNSAMPNSTAGDAAFANAAASAIFFSATTANTADAILTFVENWKTFFTNNGIPGISHPTATEVDIAARGAAWGDAVGIALANSLGLLPGQVTNFLEDAAQGTVIYGTSLAGQQNHAPFLGGGVAGIAVNGNANLVDLIGVAAHVDGMA